MHVIMFRICACTAYHSANVFLPLRATQTDVQSSLRSMKTHLENVTMPTIRRNEIATTDADHIVFDAISGSRSGIVFTEEAREMITTWDIEAFERALLLAQMSTLASQFVYVVCQLIPIALAIRVFQDQHTLSQ